MYDAETETIPTETETRPRHWSDSIETRPRPSKTPRDRDRPKMFKTETTTLVNVYDNLTGLISSRLYSPGNICKMDINGPGKPSKTTFTVLCRLRLN